LLPTLFQVFCIHDLAHLSFGEISYYHFILPFWRRKKMNGTLVPMCQFQKSASPGQGIVAVIWQSGDQFRLWLVLSGRIFIAVDIKKEKPIAGSSCSPFNNNISWPKNQGFLVAMSVFLGLIIGGFPVAGFDGFFSDDTPAARYFGVFEMELVSNLLVSNA
ncbi:hypothetical protein, partial [Dictyobacter arantiisoli]|uniref:hypothetical protein n=1 Tax=Dictyobacter arantiisoli TaxID=2014874 RepID=UPI001C0F3045